MEGDESCCQSNFSIPHCDCWKQTSEKGEHFCKSRARPGAAADASHEHRRDSDFQSASDAQRGDDKKSEERRSQGRISNALVSAGGGLTALFLGALSFALSAGLLVVFYAAVCCLIAGVDFTESAVGRFMFDQAPLLEKLARLPLNVAVVFVRATTFIYFTFIEWLIDSFHLVTGVLRFLLVDLAFNLYDMSMEYTRWCPWPAVLLYGAFWALLLQGVLLLFDFGLGELYEKVRAYLSLLKSVADLARRGEQLDALHPSFPFSGGRPQRSYRQRSAAYSSTAEEAGGVRKVANLPKTGDTSTDSFAAMPFKPFVCQAATDETGKCSEGYLSSTSKAPTGLAGSSSQAAGEGKVNKPDFDSRTLNADSPEKAKTETLFRQLRNKGTNALFPPKLERRAFQVFCSSSVASEGDTTESLSRPCMELEMKNAAGWPRDISSEQRSVEPMEQLTPVCYEMEEFASNFPENAPFLETPAVESEGECGDADFVDHECEPEELGVNNDEDWCIVAPEVAESSTKFC
ncbi:hypothetical protein, conserved [Eimeria tenella]|uniref:Transmembrane protein n=1 Tax=Eimeria tenella TaxID=5802 RepID=U6KYE3_EIMTE|nr:hypothetical protein, conserved [Eimeria tenella]CDJ41369.1 hypothetical protein, conserved [Eimeria tenella]|eukprot:XP_013232119.1 hypothetical protein, conserved [Eimeria tenella]